MPPPASGLRCMPLAPLPASGCRSRRPKSSTKIEWPMFEHKFQPLAPREKFYWRVARNFGWTLLIGAFALALGSSGYHFIAGLDWVDAFYNSAMILTVMGPVGDTPM